MTTGVAELTYGQQINTALLHLAHAGMQPVQLDTAADAIAVAYARTRLYRVALRAITACANDTKPLIELAGPERRAIAQLRAELSRSVAETQHILELQVGTHPRRSVPGRLLHAADAASLAWDLLATELTPAREPDYRARWSAGGSDARAILTDALLLVRGTSSLDDELGRAMDACARDPATPTSVVTCLQPVVDDCQAICMLGLAHASGNLLRTTREPLSVADWRHVDAVHPLPQPLPRGRITSPAHAAAAVDAYLIWLNRHQSSLTAPDLVSLATTGSRLAQLAAGMHPNLGAAARDAVQAWRLARMAVTPLRTIHPRPSGWGRAFQLVDWTDTQLHDLEAVRSSPHLRAAIATVAGRLPLLAEVGIAAIERLHADGNLLSLVVPESVHYGTPSTFGTTTNRHPTYRFSDHFAAGDAVDAFTSAAEACAALASGADTTNSPAPGPAEVQMPNRVASEPADGSATTELRMAVAETVAQVSQYRNARDETDRLELQIRWGLTSNQAAAAWTTAMAEDSTPTDLPPDDAEQLERDVAETRLRTEEATTQLADAVQLKLAARFGVGRRQVDELWTARANVDAEPMPSPTPAGQVGVPSVTALARQALPVPVSQEFAASAAQPAPLPALVPRNARRRR